MSNSAFDNLVISYSPTAFYKLNETVLSASSTITDYSGNSHNLVVYSGNNLTSVAGAVFNDSETAIHGSSPFDSSQIAPSSSSASDPPPFNTINNFTFMGFVPQCSISQFGYLINMGNPSADSNACGWMLSVSNGSFLNSGNLLCITVPGTSYGSYISSVTAAYPISSSVPFLFFVSRVNGVWSFIVFDSVNGFQQLGTSENGIPIALPGSSSFSLFNGGIDGTGWMPYQGAMQKLAFWNGTYNTLPTLSVMQTIANAAFFHNPYSPLLEITSSSTYDTLSIPIAASTGSYALAGYNLYEGSASLAEGSSPIASFLGSTGTFALQSTATEGTSKYYNAKTVDINSNLSIASNEVSSTTSSSTVYPYVQPTVALSGPTIATRNIILDQYTNPTVQVAFVDQSNNPVNLTGHILQFVVGNISPDSSGEYEYMYSSVGTSGGSGNIIINNNLVDIIFNLSNTQIPGVGSTYFLWDISTEPVVLVQGTLNITPAIFNSSDT